MATPNMLTEVKIDGTDVSANLLKWETEEIFEQELSSCKLQFSKDIYTTLSTLEIGNAITIKRGVVTATDQFIFNGYIQQITKQGGLVIIDCSDKLVDLMGTQFTYSYDKNIDTSAGVGSAIAKDIIETHGGMSATVTETSASILVTKYICNHVSVYDKLMDLANIYDYSLYYDNDDSTVHFEPKGLVESATSLEVGSNVSNVPKWNYDFSQCVNKITVMGAEQIVEDTELFSGDGTADQSNTLANVPISVKASVGGTLKTPGIDGVTSGTYHYEINKESKLVNWNQSYSPPSAGNNISIVYTRSIPIPLTLTRSESVSTYGQKAASKHLENVQTLDDAEVEGNSFLDKYSEPFITVMMKVSGTYDFDAGNLVRCIDSNVDEDRWLLIHKVVRKYPHSGDEIYLGDKEWKLADWGKLTMDRIKRLEELTNKNPDLTVEIKNIKTSLDINRRYMQVYSKSVVGDTMIWNNKIYGIWGTGKWGASTGTSEEMIRTIWNNNKVIEKFNDTDFKSASTTATWTGNGSVTFAPPAILEEAHWKFNNVATDSSGNGYDLTPTDITYAAGKINEGAVFDGSTSYLVTGASTDTIMTDDTNWSISLWFKASDIPVGILNETKLIHLAKDAGNNYAISLEIGSWSGTNYLWLNYDDGGSSHGVNVHAGIITGTWYHVVLTYDGTDFKTYLNTSSVTTNDSFSGFGSNFIFVGRKATSGDYFEGMLDDVRLYAGTTLTAGNVATLYNSGAGTEAGFPGESAISEIIYDNAVTITKAKLTADNTTNLNLYMMVDGSNWESATSGTELTFVNSGQELKWKAESTGAATLNNINIGVTE